MEALAIIAAAVIVAWALAYYEAGTRLWTVYTAALLAAILYATGAGQTSWIATFAIFAAPAAIMNIKGLRSSILTKPIFKMSFR